MSAQTNHRRRPPPPIIQTFEGKQGISNGLYCCVSHVGCDDTVIQYHGLYMCMAVIYEIFVMKFLCLIDGFDGFLDSYECLPHFINKTTSINWMFNFDYDHYYDSLAT